MNRLLTGWAFWALSTALVLALAAAVAFAVLRILPEVEAGGYAPGTATPGASGTPGPSASLIPMGSGLVPATADCAGCHLTDQGVIGLRNIPAMGHPLDGWRNCTACHATDRLVATAPGHTGIHADDCLTCHVPGNLPAPLSRPHQDRENTECLTCHGVTAPLPADMTHRSQSVCWLCHRLPEVQPPIPAHATVPGETDCLTCHVAGKVGALPVDHVGRTATECLECHNTPLGADALSWRPTVAWPSG